MRWPRSPIPHDKDAMPITVGVLQQLQHSLKVGQGDGLQHLLKLREVSSDRLQFLVTFFLTGVMRFQTETPI